MRSVGDCQGRKQQAHSTPCAPAPRKFPTRPNENGQHHQCVSSCSATPRLSLGSATLQSKRGGRRSDPRQDRANHEPSAILMIRWTLEHAPQLQRKKRKKRRMKQEETSCVTSVTKKTATTTTTPRQSRAVINVNGCTITTHHHLHTTPFPTTTTTTAHPTLLLTTHNCTPSNPMQRPRNTRKPERNQNEPHTKPARDPHATSKDTHSDHSTGHCNSL